jgi:hypothetical protein
MKKPPPLDEHQCDYATPGAPWVKRALDGLAHFHVAHSDNRFADVFTKTVLANAQGLAMGLPAERDVFIVLVSNPEVARVLVEALKPYIPLAVELPPPPKPSVQ